MSKLSNESLVKGAKTSADAQGSMTLQDLINGPFSQGKKSQLSTRLKKPNKNEKKNGEIQESQPVTLPEIPVERLVSHCVLITSTSGPKLRVVDGKIQLDQDSLFINQGPSDANTSNLQVVDESGGRFITSASFRRNKSARYSWSSAQTASFYQVFSTLITSSIIGVNVLWN